MIAVDFTRTAESVIRRGADMKVRVQTSERSHSIFIGISIMNAYEIIFHSFVMVQTLFYPLNHHCEINLDIFNGADIDNTGIIVTGLV